MDVGRMFGRWGRVSWHAERSRLAGSHGARKAQQIVVAAGWRNQARHKSSFGFPEREFWRTNHQSAIRHPLAAVFAVF